MFDKMMVAGSMDVTGSQRGGQRPLTGCFAKYLCAKNTGEGGAAAAEACNKAIAASGLARDAFFARFGTPSSN